MQTHRHQADILIIGGGVCGLNAALTAREQGRSVIVMDKAVIERSGHIAGGIDHFLAYMDTGAEWDTREAYLEFTGKKRPGRDQHRRRGFRVLSGTPPRAQAFRRNQLHPPPARRHLLPHQVLRAAPARGGSTSTARG